MMTFFLLRRPRLRRDRAVTADRLPTPSRCSDRWLWAWCDVIVGPGIKAYATLSPSLAGALTQMQRYRDGEPMQPGVSDDY